MMRDLVGRSSVQEVVLTAAFFILLTAAAYRDFKERKIPDRLVAGILIVAAVGLFLGQGPDIASRALGAFTASGPMLLAAIVRPGAFGGGDIKLMAACGLFLGAEGTFLSFFYSLLLAATYGACRAVYKKGSLKDQLAFGPFLALGMFLHFISTFISTFYF